MQIMIFGNLLGTLVPVCNLRRDNRTFLGKNLFPANQRAFALFFFRKGRVEIRLNENRFTAGRNDVLILEPGDAYAFRSTNNRPVSYYNIGIAPVTPSGITVSRKELGLEPLCRPGRPGEMARLLRTLLSAFKGKGRYRIQECSILGLRILLLLEPSGEARDLPPPLKTPDNRPPAERILDVLDFINHRYKERLALKALAARATMDLSRFSRAFRKVTGLSPHRYILEKKIAKAKDSLLLYNESLSAVAEDLGFHDYSHFSRAFSRITGMSPRRFLDDERNPT